MNVVLRLGVKVDERHKVVFARRDDEAIQSFVGEVLDCFVPRNDGELRKGMNQKKSRHMAGFLLDYFFCLYTVCSLAIGLNFLVSYFFEGSFFTLLLKRV